MLHRTPETPLRERREGRCCVENEHLGLGFRVQGLGVRIKFQDLGQGLGKGDESESRSVHPRESAGGLTACSIVWGKT